jgi:hypothetical protein
VWTKEVYHNSEGIILGMFITDECNTQIEGITESHQLKLKLNAVAWAHKQTIPTGQLLLVGEVSANFCG